MKFAGPLKAMLSGFYRAVGLDDQEIHDRIEGHLKEVPCEYLCGKTPRYAMQTLGTEWGRDLIHGQFWVKAWEAKVDRTDGPVVCDDVRFTNEANAVKSLGGEVVQMRPSILRRETSNHVAEKGIPPRLIDHTIVNDSGIGKLRSSIDAVLYPLSGNS